VSACYGVICPARAPKVNQSHSNDRVTLTYRPVQLTPISNLPQFSPDYLFISTLETSPAWPPPAKQEAQSSPSKIPPSTKSSASIYDSTIKKRQLPAFYTLYN
jgi:hypothetical protein